MNRKLTWSYGGGTQSISMLLLIKEGKLPIPDTIIMADTGREKSQTWEYHEKYIIPILDEVGMKIDIIKNDDIDLYWKGKSTLLIPAFTNKGQGMTFCSNKWKKFPVRRYLRSLGYGPKNMIITWIGMSKDEFKRMKPSGVKWQEYTSCLIFDVPMTRQDCIELVQKHGLPNPPKSSCWMCPHISDSEWLEIKTDYPEDFQKALLVQDEIMNKGNNYLFWAGISLRDLENDTPETWFESVKRLRSKQQTKINKDDFCDSGYCFV